MGKTLLYSSSVCVFKEYESSLGWKGPSSTPSLNPCHGDLSGAAQGPPMALGTAREGAPTALIGSSANVSLLSEYRTPPSI